MSFEAQEFMEELLNQEVVETAVGAQVELQGTEVVPAKALEDEPILVGESIIEDGSDASSEPACQTEGYYVDSILGDDDNDGNSSCAPWRTLQKAMDTVTSGTVFLKRNAIFYERVVLSQSAIGLDAYGVGELPTLDGSTLAENWNNVGIDVYSYQASIIKDSGEGLGHVSKDGRILNFIAWDGNLLSTFSTAAEGSYSYDEDNDTVFVKLDRDPNLSEMRISTKNTGISATSVEDILINNIKIQHFSLHGIEFRNCTRCTASAVTVTNVGGGMIDKESMLYAGNGIEFSESSRDGLVTHSDISKIFDSCVSPQTFNSNQTIENIRLEKLVLSECGFAGIEVSVLSNGGSKGSTINQVKIKDTAIANSGRGWSGRRYGTEGFGIRIKADVGAGTISGVDITGVSIWGSMASGVVLKGDSREVNLARSAVFLNDNYGIEISEPDSDNLQLNLTASVIHHNNHYGLYYNCPNCLGMTLLNNTFYDNGSINVAVFSEGEDFTLLNNVFGSESDMVQLYIDVVSMRTQINYNCYQSGTQLFGINGNVYAELSSYREATALDVDSVEGASLFLMNPAEGDFSLLTDSPCKASGSLGAGVRLDFLGEVFQMPPSMGALEF